MHKKFQIIIAYEYIIERTLDLYAKDPMKDSNIKNKIEHMFTLL